MPRFLICALLLSACAIVPRPPASGLAGCVDLGPLVYDPRNDVIRETETAGPSQVIWVHPPQTVKGHLKEVAGRAYRCTSAG
jgi:hypothetical protein